MAKSLTFAYDRIGDILSIDFNGVSPYAEQESDHLNGDDIVARYNPVTGEVENLEILSFNARMQKEGHLTLDLTPDVEIIAANKSQLVDVETAHTNGQRTATS